MQLAFTVNFLLRRKHQLNIVLPLQNDTAAFNCLPVEGLLGLVFWPAQRLQFNQMDSNG